jgi:hypothetical protein
LRLAYGALDEEEREQKVKKRVKIMKGFLADSDSSATAAAPNPVLT